MAASDHLTLSAECQPSARNPLISVSWRHGTEPSRATLRSEIRPVKPGSGRPVGGSLASKRQGPGGRSGRCPHPPPLRNDRHQTNAGDHAARPARRFHDPTGSMPHQPRPLEGGQLRRTHLDPDPAKPAAHHGRHAQQRSVHRIRLARLTRTELPDRRDSTMRHLLPPDQPEPSQCPPLTGTTRFAHSTLSIPHARATSCRVSTCRQVRW